MLVGDIKTNIRTNIDDIIGSSNCFDDIEMSAVLQDAYNDVAAKCFCIIKSFTFGFQSSTNYYDFLNSGVTDYMGAIAIFNNVSNQWLRDDVSLRDFDRLRRDWERWTGNPQFWTPHSIQYIALTPKPADNSGSAVLKYWAQAPTLTGNSDTPLIAADRIVLLEDYCTADLLESIGETTKAQTWWNSYRGKRNEYKERCLNLARADVLMRV